MKCWIFLAWIAVAESSHISCSTRTVCVLERVQLQYTVTASDLAAQSSNKRAPLAWAGIYESSSDNSNTLRARIDLYQQQLVPTRLQQMHSVIHSLDNPNLAPAVLTAEWSISSDATRRLKLCFNGPTNAPALTDPVSINNAVSMQHGTVIVSAAEAEWLDSATLALSALDDLAWQAVMGAIEAQTLHVAARTKLLPGHFLDASADTSSNSSSAAVSGSAALRVGTPGQYQLRLFIDYTQIAAAAQLLTVQACDEETVLLLPHASTTSSSSTSTAAAAAEPFWSMPGVLALSGDKWLELPDKLISDNISSSSSSSSSSAVSADWSISFWLYVQEDASASLPLALFSKGDG
eukprot:15890-Heterococcus_DN1.PRE.4